MAELEIRALRPSEIEAFVQTSYYAFHGRSLEQRRQDFAGRVTPERNILVAFEDGDIVGQVMIYEFWIWIAGVRYPTGGLANVVTPPEKARRGHARQMLRATLGWMRDELGQSLSTLYPTVYPLYRGLGWAHADDTRQITGPPTAFRPDAALPEDPAAKIVRRPARAGDVDLLAPVYTAFARERTGYPDRPRWWWEARVLGLARDVPSWLGLWHANDGSLAGYVVYSFAGPDDSQLRIYELTALRPEAYEGLLRFVAAHNLVTEVTMSAGRDVPWRSLVANPHQLKIEARDDLNYMLRIVDIPRAIALKTAEVPGVSHAVTLRVVDEHAPWNDGVWRVATSDGHWSARPAPGARPDASADISTISALFGGFVNVADAADTGLLRADARSLPVLDALFHVKYPPTSRDHF